MLKKSISILIAVCILLTCFSSVGFAEEVETVVTNDTPLGVILDAQFSTEENGGFELLNPYGDDGTGRLVTEPTEEGSENYMLKFSATQHNEGSTAANGGAEHIAVKINGDEGIKFVDGRNIIIETKFKKTNDAARVYFKYNINPKDNYKEETANLFSIVSIWDNGTVRYATGTSAGDNTQVGMFDSALSGCDTSWITAKTVIKGTSLLADIYLYDEDGTLIDTITDTSLKQPAGRTSLDSTDALYIEEATHLKTLAFRARKAATDILVDYIMVAVEEEASVKVPEIMSISGEFDVTFDSATVPSNIADYFKLYDESGEIVEDTDVTVNENKLSFALGESQTEGAKYTLKVDKAALADFGYVFDDETAEYVITASAYFVNEDFGADDNGGFELLNPLDGSYMTVEPVEENSDNYVLKYSAVNHALGGKEHILVKINGDAGIEYKEDQNIVVEARFKKNSESGRVYLKHNINVDDKDEEGYNLYSIAAIFNGNSDGVRYPVNFTAANGVENVQVGMYKLSGYSTGYDNKFVTVKAIIKGNTNKADLYFYDENGENETIITDAELGIPTGRENNTNDTHLRTLALRTRNAATDVYVDYIKVLIQNTAEVEVPETMPLSGKFDVNFVSSTVPSNIADYFELYNSDNEIVSSDVAVSSGILSFKVNASISEGDVYTLRVDKASLKALGYEFKDETTDYTIKASNYIINDEFGDGDLNGWALRISTFGTLGTELISGTDNYALKLGLTNSGYIWQNNNYAYKEFDEITYEDGTDIVIRTKFKYTDTNAGTAESPNTTYARTYFKFNVPFADEVYGSNVFSFFEVKADNGFAVANGYSTTKTGVFTTDYTSDAYKGSNKASVDGQWFDATIKIHGKTQTASIYVTDEAGNVVADAKNTNISQDASYTDFATDALKNLAFRLRHDLSYVLVDYVKVYREKPAIITVPEIMSLDGSFDVTFDAEIIPSDVAEYFELYDASGVKVENTEVTVTSDKLSFALNTEQKEGTKYILKVNKAGLGNMGYGFDNETTDYEITASGYYLNVNFGADDKGGFELLNQLADSNLSVEPIEENSENYVLKYSAANHTLNGTTAQGGDEHILVKVNGEAGIEYKENQDIIVEARFKKDSENGRVYLKHNINVNEKDEEGYNLYSIAAIFNGTSDGVRYPSGFSAANNSEKVQVSLTKLNGYSAGYDDKFITVKAVIKGNTHKADLYFYDENGENEVIITNAELGIPTGRENNVNDTHLRTLALRTRNAATDVYVDYVKVYMQNSMKLDFDGKIIDKNSNMFIWANDNALETIEPYIQLVDSENASVEITTQIMKDGSIKIDPVDTLAIGTYTLKVDTSALETYVIDESAITVNVRDNTASYSENFEDEHEWLLNTFTMGDSTDASQDVVTEDGNNFLRISLTKQGNLRNGVTSAYKFGENGFVMDSDAYTVIEAKLRTNGSNFRKYFKINTDYDNGFFANTRAVFAFDYPETGKISYFAYRQNIKSENPVSYYQGAGNPLEEYAYEQWYTVRAIFDNKERVATYYMLDKKGSVVAESGKISMNDPEPKDFTVHGAANWYNFADHNLNDREQLRYIDELAFVLRNTPTGLTEAETLDIDDIKLYNTDDISNIVKDKASVGLKKDGIDVEEEAGLTIGTYYPKTDIETSTGEAKSFTLIGVLYNGDIIEDMVTYPFSGAKGEFVADEALVITDATNRKIKVFLWNSLTGMTPVCKSIEFH